MLLLALLPLNVTEISLALADALVWDQSPPNAFGTGAFEAVAALWAPCPPNAVGIGWPLAASAIWVQSPLLWGVFAVTGCYILCALIGATPQKGKGKEKW